MSKRTLGTLTGLAFQGKVSAFRDAVKCEPPWAALRGARPLSHPVVPGSGVIHAESWISVKCLKGELQNLRRKRHVRLTSKAPCPTT
jgi:hypothetical protein